jgi:hypothetical protein
MMSERGLWPRILSLGIRLGIAPAQVWQLSIREWRSLTATGSDETLSRAAFVELAQRFPDGLS